MGTRNKIIVSILPLLLVAAQTSATNCNCDGYFCVSNAAYQLCFNGEVVGDPIPCDEGIICRNETESTCSRQPLCDNRQNSAFDKNSLAYVENLCQGQGQYPDPENCKRFYLCHGFGMGRLMSCPFNTYYNEETLTCTADMPERCGSTLDPTDDGISTMENQDTMGTSTISPEDDAQSTTQTTVIEEITTDDTDETATSTISPPTFSFECPDEGYFPDPEDCRRYYVCDVLDRPMRVSCPEGTYYIDGLLFCSKDMPARCRSTDPATTTISSGNSTTVRATTNIPNESESQTTEGMTSTSVPTPNEFVCPGMGVFPDSENCHRYYFCSGFENALSFVCPNDTYFDGESTFCLSEMPDRCKDHSSDVFSTTTSETETTEMEPSTTEETKTTARNPDGGFECPGEGYFIDRNNCRNYFFCFNSGSSYVAMPLSCPEDTYFDEESLFCTAELPERCSDQIGSSTTRSPEYEEFSCPGEGYYPDPSNCSLYYMCFADFAIPLTCPEGTYFNDETDFCRKEIPARCRDSNGTTPSYTEKPTTDKENDGFVCPGEGYYPDPEDCQYYYMCLNQGTAIPVSCPDNTYFNEESTFCTEELPERCRATERPPQNDISSTTPSTPTEEFTCPGEGWHPDPNDCQNYYICIEGNKFIPLSCPDNTYYDEKSTFCVKNMPDRCRATGRPTQDNTYETTTPKNNLETTSAPAEDGFTCPQEGYYPDPRDCHRYYVCFGFGSPVKLTCPHNTYFDDKGFCSMKRPERCNEPEYSTKPPKQQQPDVETEFKCSAAGKFPDPNSCRKYWICYSEKFGYSVECPNGTYYHQDSTYCTSDKPDRCKTAEDEYFKCPGEGYYADPSDCHTYHFCYSSHLSTAIRCPGNSYYHQSIKGCAPDVPLTCQNAGKGERFVCPRAGYFPDPRDCSRYYVCNFWGDALLMKCPRGRYFNENIRGCSSLIPPRCQTLTPPLQNEFMCLKTGYFADPVNCSLYHACNFFGLHYTLSCPPHNYYHENTRTCSPILPERCIYLAIGRSLPYTLGSRKDIPILSETGNVLNNTFVCPDKGLFPDPNDCHKFYVCYGKPRQVTCWGKSYYNAEMQKCEKDMPERCKAVENETQPPIAQLPTLRPEEFICHDEGLFPDPYDCRRFYVCYGKMRIVTCREGQYYNEETQKCGEKMPERCNDLVTPPPTVPSTAPGNENFVCPHKGLFPDPQNCHRFYVCYGQPRRVTCRDEMYFDEEYRRCVEEMPERCKDGSGNVTLPTGAPPTTPQPAEFVCPRNGLFAHPTNCHKFYVCYGEQREITCRGNTYYDTEIRECVEEMPERCRNNGDDEGTPPTMAPPTSNPGEFICPGNGLFSDPEDCRKFYVCYGKLQHVTCRGGMYFHENVQQCRKELPDSCVDKDDQTSTSAPSPSTTTETPTTPKEIFECRNPGRYPDPSDCQSFYICDRRRVAFHFNCRDSTYFNDVTKKCEPRIPDRCKSDDDRITTTTPKFPSDTACTDSGNFPDPNDCLSYYYCSDENSEPLHYTCPTNQFFNADKRKCKKIKTGNECPTRNPDRFPSDEDSDEDDDDDDDNDDDSEENFRCTTPGLFPDPRDCKKYYECSFSLKMKHKTCGGRTYFNELLRHCSIFTTSRCRTYGFFG